MNLILPIISLVAVPSISALPVQDQAPTVRPLTEVSVTELAQSEGPERERIESRSAIDRRVQDILNDANARYWKNRARMKTLPQDRWTPQQAGWMDASGRPLVVNWPWWAW